jgi:predicted nucleic acid-binding Zn ribbon protein
MSFTPLGDELKRVFTQNSTLKKQIEASSIVDVANEVLKDVFGKEVGEMARPIYLKNRTLTISCSNSVMAQELRLNQAIIVEKLNKKLGKKDVDRIRYLL